MSHGKIYVASSWRNGHQPAVVAALRQHGYEVYDFRNPRPGEPGFAWSSVHPAWKEWSLEDYVRALGHDRAEQGFHRDREALEWCDLCVLVLPAGPSAHLEAGWCSGRGKPVVVYAPEPFEPELMYKLFESKAGIGPYVHKELEELLDGLKPVVQGGTGLR